MWTCTHARVTPGSAVKEARVQVACESKFRYGKHEPAAVQHAELHPRMHGVYQHACTISLQAPRRALAALPSSKASKGVIQTLKGLSSHRSWLLQHLASKKAASREGPGPTCRSLAPQTLNPRPKPWTHLQNGHALFARLSPLHPVEEARGQAPANLHADAPPPHHRHTLRSCSPRPRVRIQRDDCLNGARAIVCMPSNRPSL